MAIVCAKMVLYLLRSRKTDDDNKSSEKNEISWEKKRRIYIVTKKPEDFRQKQRLKADCNITLNE